VTEHVVFGHLWNPAYPFHPSGRPEFPSVPALPEASTTPEEETEVTRTKKPVKASIVAKRSAQQKAQERLAAKARNQDGVRAAIADRPEPGKVYALTGSANAISSGDSWADSEVKIISFGPVAKNKGLVARWQLGVALSANPSKILTPKGAPIRVTYEEALADMQQVELVGGDPHFLLSLAPSPEVVTAALLAGDQAESLPEVPVDRVVDVTAEAIKAEPVSIPFKRSGKLTGTWGGAIKAGNDLKGKYLGWCRHNHATEAEALACGVELGEAL